MEPGSVTILPPPGRYSGPVSVTLRSTTPGDTLYLRRGLQLPWELYSGPVTLSNTTEVAFYSENSSTSTRSRLQSATYEFPVQAQPFTPAAGSNLPPIAVAGSVQRLLIARSTQVFLDGTRSRDPEGGPLSYQWQQLKGPPLILIGGDTASPSFFTPAFTNTLVLQFRLIVYDDHQVSSVSETAVVLDDGCVKPPYVPPTSGFGEDGSFNGALRWPGLPEQEVQIQASIDLENWTDLGIGTSDLLGWVVFTDLAAGTYSQRFYRAILR